MHLHPIHLNGLNRTSAPYAVEGGVGHPDMPMFNNAATPMEALDLYREPEGTVEGPVCGACSAAFSYPGVRRKVRHASVAHIRMCWWITKELEAQSRAEQWAEGALVRHYENAGWAEVQAERDWEDRRGVVQFDVAFRRAMAALPA